MYLLNPEKKVSYFGHNFVNNEMKNLFCQSRVSKNKWKVEKGGENAIAGFSFAGLMFPGGEMPVRIFAGLIFACRRLPVKVCR